MTFSIRQEPGFYLDRDKATTPYLPGIYVAYKCDYDPFADTVALRQLLYIGETPNLNVHLNTIPPHYKALVKASGGANHLCYAVIPMEEFSEQNRKWIHSALIHSQHPPLNPDETEPHPPIDLTLHSFPPSWPSHIHISGSIIAPPQRG